VAIRAGYAVDTLRALLFNQRPGRHLPLTLTEFGALTAVAFTLTGVLFNRTATT
jgi:hypothetical protein